LKNIELKDLLAKIFAEEKKVSEIKKKAEEFDYIKKTFEVFYNFPASILLFIGFA